MMEIKSKFKFAVSPRFETFFALQALTDPESRIHDAWKQSALRRLPQRFHRKLASIGGSPFLWPTVADTLEDAPLSLPFEDMIARIAELPQRELQERIFLGIFHNPDATSLLLSGKTGLATTIARIARIKREWLAFIGLYPVTKDAPLLSGLEFLLRAPAEFQKIICELLDTFWNVEFKETWEQLRPKFEKSCQEKERLFQSCSLAEFARIALLRVEIDERKGLIKAVRGGAAVPLKDLAEVTILPSAFNDKRHWTTYGGEKTPGRAYFPYFDPSISFSWIPRAGESHNVEPETDPALIFRALGDATRYAMVSLLARNPLTSADLAKSLELSRPTVSHHIHVLREAGLLEEKLIGNAVLLSLKREVFDQLSELVTHKLFHSQDKIHLTRTRSK